MRHNMGQNNRVNEVTRVLLLTLLLTILYSVDFISFRIQTDAAQLPYTFVMALLSTMIINYTIKNSQWTGWKLVSSIFLIFFGLRTLLTQVETYVFVPELVDEIPYILVNDALTILIFTLASVHLTGKLRSPETHETEYRLNIPWTQWLWKPLLISVLYVIIYIVIGLFVFRPIANILDPVALAQYIDVETPGWILPFQLLRGLTFIAISLPTMMLLKGSWKRTALTVALLYAVIMGVNLIAPIPQMPDTIRIAHLIEVFTENFIYGWAVVWILQSRTNWKIGDTKCIE